MHRVRELQTIRTARLLDIGEKQRAGAVVKEAAN
jgi:hypothetical protein